MHFYILGLPFEAYSIWQAYPFSFGEVFCIGKALLTEMTSYASVLTITAFTVERYIAICHPLMSHKIADLRRSVLIIIGIWTVSFLIALPYPVHTRTLFYEHSPTTGKPLHDSLVCTIPPEWIFEMTVMFQISTFLFFIVPMTAIIILYVLIAITLRRTALNRANSEESTGGHHSSHTRRVVRMLGKCITNLFVLNKVKVNEEARKIVLLFLNFDTMLNTFNYCVVCFQLLLWLPSFSAGLHSTHNDCTPSTTPNSGPRLN